MFAQVSTVAFEGIDAKQVDIQADGTAFYQKEQ
jgi:hypothetical protein